MGGQDGLVLQRHGGGDSGPEVIQRGNLERLRCDPQLLEQGADRDAAIVVLAGGPRRGGGDAGLRQRGKLLQGEMV
ncbi:hypothetical protein D3C85_1688230 [compost metagenome]